MHMCEDFRHHFVVHGRDIAGHARTYLGGILSRSERKNIECIQACVKDANYQAMQQMITDSPWKHQALMDQVAAVAGEALGGHSQSALYLDESGFAKKGDKSVGVQRQYCGRLGKVDNCQVGVYACLGRGERAAIIDFRLFLPESWVEDAARCDRAKVPVEERRKRSKPQLALEMVRHAVAQGVKFSWVGGDEVYGNSPHLIAGIEELGLTWLMDVACTTGVWKKKPGAKDKSRSVKDLVAVHFEGNHREVVIRQTSQGPLRAKMWATPVWVSSSGWAGAHQRLLVVRQEADGSFKYSMSNAAPETSLERLGYMQAQRFWIERAFQDAKSELGMSHYEVRGWKGWHHHMALVCLALLFVMKERMAAQAQVPLLSARDVVELLDYYLPRPKMDEQELFARLKQRHEQRKQAMEAHKKRTRRGAGAKETTQNPKKL
jgi:SRSO17 transposase